MWAGIKISNRRLRESERVAHLVAGLLLVAYVYLPGAKDSALATLVQFVAVPVLVGSGMAMWQLPRARRYLASRRAASRRPVDGLGIAAGTRARSE